jgi:thymidylate synthase (FAD)
MVNKPHIKVLDKGYVRVQKWMGDDLDPVNSAKASFMKESTDFGDREARLLAFLNKEEHSSVFRHSAITFEIYAPLLIARQWWKYAVASTHVEDQLGWNESSRRYVTEIPEFYIPAADEWRSAPENRKQGSGPVMDAKFGEKYTNFLKQDVIQGITHYDLAMSEGMAPEQARLFLPAYGLYVRWRWTCSLGALIHFLQQRLADDAQYEIRAYASAVLKLIEEMFPEVVKMCLEEESKNAVDLL